MLAKLDWQIPSEPLPEPSYSGFPFWEAFLAVPNREEKTATWLEDKFNIHIYWPNYIVQMRCGRRSHTARRRSVLVGTLLLPSEILNVPNRDRILDYAGLRPRSYGRLLTKIEIDIIREIEAKLNVRFDKKTYNFEIGQRVRFLNELYAAFLGEGTVIEVATGNRISIKIAGKLFGGKDVMTIPAAELEAM